MSNPAQGPITLYAPKPVSGGMFPPSSRPKFQSKFKLIFSVLLSLGIGAGFYLLTDEVRGVITEGGSAVTLDRILDSSTVYVGCVGYRSGADDAATDGDAGAHACRCHCPDRSCIIPSFGKRGDCAVCAQFTRRAYRYLWYCVCHRGIPIVLCRASSRE